MSSFAGFWVDGAKRKPVLRNCDGKGWVIVKYKDRDEVDCYRYDECTDNWNLFYWLDTSTPKELTPEQLFDIYKILYPNLQSIRNTGSGWSIDRGHGVVNIIWGDSKEYPKKERWRIPTDADKGKPCRFKNTDRAWNNYDNNYLATFWTTKPSGGFLIQLSDFSYDTTPFCEVKD